MVTHQLDLHKTCTLKDTSHVQVNMQKKCQVCTYGMFIRTLDLSRQEKEMSHDGRPRYMHHIEKKVNANSSHPKYRN